MSGHMEMIGWHHRLDGHQFEQAPGNNEGQGSLACCSPWGHKESDMMEQLNKKSLVTEAGLGQDLGAIKPRWQAWNWGQVDPERTHCGW